MAGYRYLLRISNSRASEFVYVVFREMGHSHSAATAANCTNMHMRFSRPHI